MHEAVRRKDNSYVAANLASAYARAGFVADAEEYLRDIPVEEQQEGIVQAAYRNVADQKLSDREAIEKLERLIRIEKDLFDRSGSIQLDKTVDDLIQMFVGDWKGANGFSLSIDKKGGELDCKLTIENEYYEHASYKVVVRYEPGLLELEAELDEKSLKERRTSNPPGT